MTPMALTRVTRHHGAALAAASLLGLLAASPGRAQTPEPPKTPAPDASAQPAPDKADAPALKPIGEAQEVRPGSVVHLEFTLRNDNGEALDSSRGRAPLVFTQGEGQIIPGLDRGVLGMKVGEQKQITVPPEDAYGPVDPEAVTEVPKSRVPPDALEVGTVLVGRTRSGREIPVRVREVKEETVVLDLNHPLAGQTLLFEVTIILIEPAP